MSSFDTDSFDTDSFDVDSFDIDASGVASVFTRPVVAKGVSLSLQLSHAAVLTDASYHSVRIFKS